MSRCKAPGTGTGYQATGTESRKICDSPEQMIYLTHLTPFDLYFIRSKLLC